MTYIQAMLAYPEKLMTQTLIILAKVVKQFSNVINIEKMSGLTINKRIRMVNRRNLSVHNHNMQNSPKDSHNK